MFAELDSVCFGVDGFFVAVDGGSCLGFGVEGIEVGHAARHVEIDDVFGFASTAGEHAFIGSECGCGEELCHGATEGDSETGFGCVCEEFSAV